MSKNETSLKLGTIIKDIDSVQYRIDNISASKDNLQILVGCTTTYSETIKNKVQFDSDLEESLKSFVLELIEEQSSRLHYKLEKITNPLQIAMTLEGEK